MSNNLKILIVGAGVIAREYVKVVEALGYRALVVGRGDRNVNEVRSAFPSALAISGGLEKWLEKNEAPLHAIIATPIDHLATSTEKLLSSGCKYILAEKPLTYSIPKAKDLAQMARENNARVNIAFNRRSYTSVQEAQKLIERDGGVSSFHFDFTEASFRIDPKNYSKETNRLWGIANSSHVIDTAFHLGGKPEWIECRQYGEAVNWHPAGSIFTGMGVTMKKVPFTYHANWGCPGKWNIEIMTPKRKLLFSPMEHLHQQVEGSFNVELVKLDYDTEKVHKPGFFGQVSNWLKADNSNLPDLDELANNIRIMTKMFGYTDTLLDE